MDLQTKNVLIPVFLVMVFAFSIFPITDNDVWWHLSTGHYIATHGSIPSSDMFSYTIFGKPWLAFEWLAQLLMYAVYASAGLGGLTVAKALMAAGLFLVLYRTSPRVSTLAFIGAGAVAFIAMRDGFRERPQMFTYLLTALFLAILRGESLRRWYVLPGLMLLWANTHGAAAFIGVGLVWVHVLFSRRGTFRQRAIPGLLTLAMLFASPHGYRVISYLFTLFNEHFNDLILEYRPPPWTFAYVPFAGMLAVAIHACWRRFRGPVPSSLTDVMTVLIAAIAALMAIRNIPLFCIIAFPVIVEDITVTGRGLIPPRARAFARFRSVRLLAGCACLMVLAGAARAFDAQGKYRFGLGDAHRGRTAAAFLWNARIQGNLFNDYDLGGYLIWSVYPRYRIFVDGRLVEFGRDLVERSYYYWKPAVWQGLDEQYRFSAAIIPQESFYAAAHFDAMKEWILVYWDDDAMIYLKKNIANARLISQFGYRFLRPNSPWQGYLLSCPRSAVIGELRRSAYYAPGSRRARTLLSYVLGAPRPT